MQKNTSGVQIDAARQERYCSQAEYTALSMQEKLSYIAWKRSELDVRREQTASLPEYNVSRIQQEKLEGLEGLFLNLCLEQARAEIRQTTMTEFAALSPGDKLKYIEKRLGEHVNSMRETASFPLDHPSRSEREGSEQAVFSFLDDLLLQAKTEIDSKVTDSLSSASSSAMYGSTNSKKEEGKGAEKAVSSRPASPTL